MIIGPISIRSRPSRFSPPGTGSFGNFSGIRSWLLAAICAETISGQQFAADGLWHASISFPESHSFVPFAGRPLRTLRTKRNRPKTDVEMGGPSTPPCISSRSDLRWQADESRSPASRIMLPVTPNHGEFTSPKPSGGRRDCKDAAHVPDHLPMRFVSVGSNAVGHCPRGRPANRSASRHCRRLGDPGRDAPGPGSRFSTDKPRLPSRLLETQLLRINGNPAYLGLLREAYSAYVKDPELAHDDERCEVYQKRLRILDKSAAAPSPKKRRRRPKPPLQTLKPRMTRFSRLRGGDLPLTRRPCPMPRKRSPKNNTRRPTSFFLRPGSERCRLAARRSMGLLQVIPGRRTAQGSGSRPYTDRGSRPRAGSHDGAQIGGR